MHYLLGWAIPILNYSKFNGREQRESLDLNTVIQNVHKAKRNANKI